MVFRNCIFLLFILSGSLFGQEFTGKLVSNFSKEILDQKFSKYEVIQLDVASVQNALTARSNVHHLKLMSPSLNWDLSLTEFEMFKKDYIQNVGNDQGVTRTHIRPNIKTYKVLPNSKRAGLSCLTISDNFIYGFVEDAGVKTYIEPLFYLDPKADKNLFISYRENEVYAVKGLHCGADELEYNKNIGQVEVEKDINSVRAGCKTIDVALAADKKIFDSKGGTNGAEAFMIGVLNNVQTNYDNEFTTAIEFGVSATFVAETAGSDPWNLINDINSHLTTHRMWANGGGYGGAGYAVATAWTNKYNGTIGLAYVGTICGSFRYNVCSDFGGSSGLLRCLQAHEMGHNFNSGHDASNSGFIMAPAVSNSTTWSPASQAVINSYIVGIGCAGSCGSGLPPVSDFSGSPETICPGKTVNFIDETTGGTPTSWAWTFPGGTPSSSTLQNPVITYKNTGKYDVTLKVTNTFGNNTKTKTQYIEVLPLVVNSFTSFTIDRDLFLSNNTTDADTYVWKFGDGNTSFEFEPFYTYAKDGTFTVELCASNSCGTVCKNQKVVVVTPVDANFTADTQEGCSTLKVKYRNLSSPNSLNFAWSFPGGIPSISSEKEPLISYPTKGIYDAKLTVSNSKYTSTKVEKGFVRVDSKPKSEFDNKAPLGNSIEFINQTVDSIIPWRYKYQWSFGDGVKSTEKNPTHVFPGSGKYKVCLISDNTCGLDTLCKDLEISGLLSLAFGVNANKGCLPFVAEFKNSSNGASAYKWNFPGGVPSTSTDVNPKITYNQKGTYDVLLTAFSGQDSAILSQKSFIIINDKPTAQFSKTITKTLVKFNSNASNGATYFWNFGDNFSSTEQNPEHDYKAEGEYRVELTMTNECGESRIISMISVYLIPKINFIASSTDICAGDYIQLSDLSSNDVNDWKWQIEGGSPSNSIDKNPKVRFDKAGLYTIKLTVKNSNGDNSLTKTSYIKVKSPIFCPNRTGKKNELSATEGDKDEIIHQRTSTHSVYELNIVPNPSNGIINVQLPDQFDMNSSRLSIMNIHGLPKLINNAKLMTNNSLELNLNEFESGVYVLFIQTLDEILSQKFVLLK
ncbi:MAG: PKD domain-containing protein [Saprospiraceae bacterium]